MANQPSVWRELGSIKKVSPTVRGRVFEMDGLRGWASLSVMLSHLLFGVFIKLQPPLVSPVLREVLVEPFLAGTLDVAVFFVVSGDALSAS
jgi:peptidoglycan/LPS O-acetylase OafA/YrhL